MFIAPFLMPLLGSGKKLRKAGGIALVIYFVYLMLGIISLLFLIPSITEVNSTLSIYILSRRTNFGSFIQRIDAIFILIWIMSIFNYLAITTHFSLISFKKVVNIKHENGMIFCFAGITYIISLIPQSISDVHFFNGTIYKYISIIFVFFVTMFILIWAYIKKKRSIKKGEF